MSETKSPLRYLLPASIQAPLAAYSHGVVVPSDSDLIFCSGQLGISADGKVSANVAEQAEQCFENIRCILAEGGMTLADVVRINAFVTNRSDMGPYMVVRDRLFSNPAPASTLMIVSGFTREDFKVEIEVVAARRRDARL